MPKLTKRFVEAIVPDSKKATRYWDDELRRFGIIVLPSGRRTYCIEYRNADRVQKRVKIGVHGQITAEEARNLAKIRLGQVAHGDDIAEKSRKIRNLPIFADLARDYIERHGPKKKASSLKEDKWLLKNTILPVFGSMKVESIDRRTIETLHCQLSKTPYKANHILSLLSKMFTLAISWGWRQDNPVKGIQKYYEQKRDRWLNYEEMQRLWEVLDRYFALFCSSFLKVTQFRRKTQYSFLSFYFYNRSKKRDKDRVRIVLGVTASSIIKSYSGRTDTVALISDSLLVLTWSYRLDVT